MPYIEKFLLKDEKLVYITWLHWIVFISPVIGILVGLFIVSNYSFRGILYDFFREIGFYLTGEQVNIVLTLFGGVLMAWFFIRFIFTIISFQTTEFGVTDKRVIVKYGFIKRSSFELLLKKIEGIRVYQGIFGRVLDFGTIIVSGTGGSRDYFLKIKSPFKLRKVCQEQIDISDKN